MEDNHRGEGMAMSGYGKVLRAPWADNTVRVMALDDEETARNYLTYVEGRKL